VSERSPNESGRFGGPESYRLLVARAQHLTREEFIAERKDPVLLQYGEIASPDGKGVGKTASGFQTVIPGVTTHSKRPRPLQIFSLMKRPGANAFSHMVTVGRAHNNDIVLAEAAISKFHLSFTQRDGAWHVTDSSTHGTLLGQTKLKKGEAVRVESGSILVLSRTVSLRFLSPEDLFAFLVTGSA
jgi:hypothetical protein